MAVSTGREPPRALTDVLAQQHAATEESKQKVRHLLDKWIAEQSRNPSTTDLNVPATVIAFLALQYPKKLKELQILRDIMRLYRNINYHQPRTQHARLVSAVQQAIQGYEFPVVRTAATALSYFCRKDYLKHAQSYYVPLAAATIFLQPFLAQQRIQSSTLPLQPAIPFRLLDLPPEIRDQIFSLVLGVPSSMVSIYRNPQKPFISMSVMDNLHDNSWRHWRSNYPHQCSYLYPIGPRYHGPPITLQYQDVGRMLSLLCTSKVIYREALPIFFGVNHFFCLKHLHEFLRLPNSRLDLIRNVTVLYTSCHKEFAAECFTRLGRIEKLQRLEVHLCSSDFGTSSCVDEHWNYRQRDGAELPGMRNLYALKMSKKNVVNLSIH